MFAVSTIRVKRYEEARLAGEPGMPGAAEDIHAVADSRHVAATKRHTASAGNA